LPASPHLEWRNRLSRNEPSDLLCARNQVVKVSSQLRDTYQFLFDQSARTRLEAPKRYEVNASPQESFEFILQVKVSSKRRGTLELD